MYESDMLMATARLLASGTYAKSTLENVLLESFAAHARTLLHCFYPPAPGKGQLLDDDVIAKDFFDEPSAWEAVCPPLPAELVAIRERVNKELAHLTYTRIGITERDKVWPFMQIAAAFVPTLKAFAAHVPNTRLSVAWAQI